VLCREWENRLPCEIRQIYVFSSPKTLNAIANKKLATVNKSPLKVTLSSTSELQCEDREKKIKALHTLSFLKFTVALTFKSYLLKKVFLTFSF